MGNVTTSPVDEACQALVARINSGILYTLPTPAVQSELAVDQLDEIDGFRVDVVHDTGKQLAETLELEDNTSHIIRVWIRDKLDDMDPATIAPRNLLVRQIEQRLQNYANTGGRVRVWAISEDRGEIPGKLIICKNNLYRAYIEARVEVLPPA
jgi:hypothetical protein